MSDSAPIPPAAPIEQDILIEGHSYDGIQEYDNPLPGWWKWLFILCILFAIPYTIWYHVMDGNSVYDKYRADEAAAAERQAQQLAAMGGGGGSEVSGLAALLTDQSVLQAGAAIYQTRCLACHAPDGGGMAGLGVNFCDDYAKNFNSIEEIPQIVTNGVPGTAMTPWKGILNELEIRQVSVYVASLRGTTPANPKDPEGEIIPPWGS